MDGKKDKVLIQATLSVPDGARLLHAEVCNVHDEDAALFMVKLGFEVNRETLQGIRFILRGQDAVGILLNESDRTILLATFLDLRNTLRSAWKDDPQAIETIRLLAQMSTKLTFTDRGQLEIVPPNPWSLACILFLRSYAKGKCATCLNPDCHSPFYVRIKHTQKFCTDGPCMLYMRRQNSRDYYWDAGKAKRTAKQAKARRRKS